MKKILLVIGLVLAAGLWFTSESPSLDGRAVVADEGVFPRGLFAKTVGYLPGDSISVTNPANGERVEILVIGSLDPSDGVAVLLSPEAAESLNIKKNSNNLVKLTKRNGAADEVVSGSAVLTNDGLAPAEEKTIEQVVEEAIENNVPVEDAVAAAVEKAEENVADKAFDSAESKLEEEVVAEAEPEPEPEPEAEVVEEIVEDDIVEDGLAESPAKEELVVDELAAAEESDVDDDIIEDTVIDEPLDEFDAIVLVPSESKAPEAAETESEKEEVAAISSPDIDAPVPAPAVVKSSGVAYVNGYGDLADQKYYVQIAVYKSSENVEQIANKYSDLYPITVVQQGSKSPVLVGPLNVDEYGVVLERFRSYGFKDAFVKVGRESASSAASSAYINER
ncbi:MAG: hypothetical protein II814_05660 [Treponema sp.]|nr:hypothetical protein [Treponema sp.]